MDSQDHHSNNISSGHENHICHRCGWPFPNPHPSAKHRRAHKKNCGTIEGYKIIESNAEQPHLSVSDDEHPSDDDLHSPGPKMEERSVQKSIKSEDEEFSDAVMEFSDSGVALGNEDVEKQLLKVDTTADMSGSSNDKKLSSQTSSSEVIHSAKDQPETAKSLNDVEVEKSSTESSRIIASQLDSSPVKFGTPSDMPMKEKHVDVDRVTEKEPNVTGNEEDELGKALNDSIDPHVKAVRELSEQESNLEEAGRKTSDSLIQESVIPETDRERDSESGASKEKSLDLVSLENVVDEPVILDTKQTSESQTLEPVILEANRERDSELEASKGKSSTCVVLDNVVDEPVIVETKQLSESQTLEPVIPEANPEKDYAVDEPVILEAKQILESQTQESVIPQADLERNSKLETSKEISSVCLTQENVVNEPVATNYNLQMRDGQISDPVYTDIIEQKEDENDETEVIVYKCDLSSLVKPLTHVEDSVTDFARARDGSNQSKMVGVSDGRDEGNEDPLSSNLNKDHEETSVSDSKEQKDEDAVVCNLSEAPKDDVTLFSVPKSSAVMENVENMIKGFKDYNTMKTSSQRDLGNAEVIRLVQGDDEATIETANLIVGENAKNNEINEIEEKVAARKESSKEPLENELPASNKTTQEHADISFISEDNQTNGAPEVDQNQLHERDRDELLDTERGESTKVSHEQILLTDKEAAHDSAGQTEKSPSVNMVPNEVVDASGNLEKTYSSLDRCTDESEASQGSASGNITGVAESAGSSSKDIQGNREGSLLASDVNPEGYTLKEIAPHNVDYEILNSSSATVEISHTTEAVQNSSDSGSEPSRDEVDDKLEKQHDAVSAIDISVASSGRADSLEGNWGSVSVVSTQSDTTATADAGSLPSADSQPPKKSDAYLDIPKKATDEIQPHKSDVFDAPSFMTLVESGNHRSPKAASSETQIENNIEQPKHKDLQAAWFPSLSNVVTESQGRKKNEEIIEKVSNWTTGKQHSPLKNLLVEAKSPKPKQVPTVTQSDETATKSDGDAESSVNPVLHSDEPNNQTDNKELEKEWGSPARYPSEMKKAKKKGKPYWVPFVCCSSVHRDL